MNVGIRRMSALAILAAALGLGNGASGQTKPAENERLELMRTVKQVGPYRKIDDGAALFQWDAGAIRTWVVGEDKPRKISWNGMYPPLVHGGAGGMIIMASYPREQTIITLLDGKTSAAIASFHPDRVGLGKGGEDFKSGAVGVSRDGKNIYWTDDKSSAFWITPATDTAAKPKMVKTSMPPLRILGGVDATTAIVVTRNGFEIYDTGTGKKFGAEVSTRVDDIAVAPVGKVAATVGSDSQLKIWSLGVGGSPKTMSMSYNISPHVAITQDGQYAVTAASGSGDGEVILWDLATGKHVAKQTIPDQPTAVNISEDGGSILVSTRSQAIMYLDMKGGKWAGRQKVVATRPVAPTTRLAPVARGNTARKFLDPNFGVMMTSQEIPTQTAETSPATQKSPTQSAPATKTAMTPAMVAATQRAAEESNGFKPFRTIEDGGFFGQVDGQSMARWVRGSLLVWTAGMEKPTKYPYVGDPVNMLAVGGGRLVTVTHTGGRSNVQVIDQKDGSVFTSFNARRAANLINDSVTIRGLAISTDGKDIIWTDATKFFYVCDMAGDPRVFNLGTPARTLVRSTDPGDIIVALEGGALGICAYTGNGGGVTMKRAFTGHTDTVTAIATAPKAGKIATVADDWTCRVWPITGGAASAVIPLENVGYNYVTITDDGKFLATTGFEGTEGNVSLWDAATGKRIGRMSISEPLTALSISGDGKYVLGSSSKGRMLEWAIIERPQVASSVQPVPVDFKKVLKPVGSPARANSQRMRVLQWFSAAAAIVWSKDDFHITLQQAGLKEFTLKTDVNFWFSPGEKATSNEIAFVEDIRVGVTWQWGGFAVSGDRKLAVGIMASDTEGAAYMTVWDIQLKKKLWEIPLLDIRYTVAVSPDGNEIFLADGDSTQVFDRGGKVLRKLDVPNIVAISPKGGVLAGVVENALLIFETKTGRLKHRIDVDMPVKGGQAIGAVAISPDETRAAVLRPESYHRGYVINLKSGAVEWMLRNPNDRAHDLVFSADGDQILGVADYGFIRWEIP